MNKLRRLLEHPLVDFVVSLLLIGASLVEGWETLARDLREFRAGVHHGVLLFGIVTFLRSLPEVYETGEKLWQRHFSGKTEKGAGTPAAAHGEGDADRESEG